MKKIYSLTLLMAAGLSYGQVLDSFTGTGLVSANGWTTHSGTAGQMDILDTASDSGNSLSYPGLVASAGNRITIVAGEGEDVNKPLPTAVTSGSVYYSALIKVTNTDNLWANDNATGDYFLSFSSTVGSTGVTGLFGRLSIKKGSEANTVNLGILNSGGGTGAVPTFLTTNYPVGSTILIVVKHELAINTATLWVNPTPGQAEGTGTTNAGGNQSAPTSLAGIAIRQGGNLSETGGSTGNVQIDEIRTGATYASVTPAATAGVKESAIAGLKVFPNPLKGNVLNITSNANAAKTVAIFDVLGKQVVNTTTESTTINVSNLTSGVYIVKITEEGKTATKKLVVE